MSTHAARRVAPRSVRVAAAALVAALPLTAVAVNYGDTTPSASAQDASQEPTLKPFETQAAAEANGYVPEDEAGWRQWVYRQSDETNEDGTPKPDGGKAGDRYGRMEELAVKSPAMGGREIPVVTIRANVNPESAPTVYLLNGADGGTGRANWLQQTSAIEFYGNEIGRHTDENGEVQDGSNVNVVIPMAGAFSYYTDWELEHPTLDEDGNGVGTKQMWETFLTKELPAAMEGTEGESGHFQSTSDERAIIGMSMSASSVLVFGEQNPGFYDAIASYSGCPATTGTAELGVDLVLDRGDATYEQMWGPRGGAVARRNDAQLNVGKLKDQHNIYISAGTGLMGEHDVASGDRLRGNPVGSITPATEGGVIEGATNVCTHLFKAAADKAGVTEENNNITYNFRNTGTHQWGYWQDDMFESWPTIARGLGFDEAEAIATRDKAAADYLDRNQGIGNAGSLPLLTEAFQQAQAEQAAANGEQ
ncbi:alpha/beta hydrolase family protein [Corynebacterium sp.]|jgi:S-formylglutathione hydrolase FrmB|uniref:alpha/beta hydrolase n=1 Tax=Corynebacterium sp. TaxID=1720 RepID=UPI0025BA207E|nr:alpha/beta hydrolase family protein [Corynebacterium sp.]